MSVIPANELEVGKVYECRHARKGVFKMRIASVTGEWIEGVIVSGRADAAMSYNVCDTGETVTVRDSFCHFFNCDEQTG